MKKFISVILSVMMVISVGAMATIPAMAYTVNSSTGEPVVGTTVNGAHTSDVTVSVDNYNPNRVTFKYTGKKTVDSWTFEGLTPDTDYVVVGLSQDKTQVIIELSPSGMAKDFTANAITTSGTVEPGKVDGSSTSPNTGATMAGIAVAGVGVSMLAALKKRD